MTKTQIILNLLNALSGWNATVYLFDNNNNLIEDFVAPLIMDYDNDDYIFFEVGATNVAYHFSDLLEVTISPDGKFEMSIRVK